MSNDILGSIGDGVMQLDTDCVIRYTNETMREMLQAQGPELEGRPLGEMLSETELLGMLGVEDALAAGGPAWLQVVFKGIQGRYIPLSVTLSHYFREAAEPGGYVLVCRDQTEIREFLNDSSRVAAEEIERRVELQRAKDEAERRERLQMEVGQAQKLEAIGQLAAGIAHEINTPIQFVGDNVVFLQRAFTMLMPLVEHAQKLAHAEPDTLSDMVAAMRPVIRKAKLPFVVTEVPKAIEQTLEGIERVAKIVRAMKEVSHPSSGELQPIDLHRIIESTVTVARNEWKYVATLETDFDQTLPTVPCYSDEISQVILNVVVNAAHAIAESLGPNPSALGTIRISTRHLAPWVELRIRDSGTGMPPEVVKRIFDPFFTTKEVGKGTGQGLSLAYHVVVKKHNGTIDVETVPGAGATFIIRLPLDHAETQRNSRELPAISGAP